MKDHLRRQAMIGLARSIIEMAHKQDARRRARGLEEVIP